MPRGGTNIHDALLEALRQKPAEGALPIVLFLTDGLPTIGETKEETIRNLVEANNSYKRRVFTFGVGLDVNTPLLSAMADKTRATATYVLPKEDIEVKVGGMFNQMTGPVLSDVELATFDSAKKPAIGRVLDVLPGRLPDLFEGQQIVVLGKYVGEEPLTFKISGNYRGQIKEFNFDFDSANASTRHSFVPRLWASRKIGGLVDAVRQIGADADRPLDRNDPKIKELVDEIVNLSLEFGILTEYTAFFAGEGATIPGTPMPASPAANVRFEGDKLRNEAVADASSPVAAVSQELQRRAVVTRSGAASLNQEFNTKAMKNQNVLNGRNDYVNADLTQNGIAYNVQQINGNTFYFANGRWIDSRLLKNQGEMKIKEVEIGSPEYFKLVEELEKRNQQGAVSMPAATVMEMDGEAVMLK
jgi:Ca-activated chloride channel homolog